MTDHFDLIRSADEFRQRAEHEADERLRRRFIRMADRYAHLAESQARSEAHPPDVAALADLFTKRP